MSRNWLRSWQPKSNKKVKANAAKAQTASAAKRKASAANETSLVKARGETATFPVTGNDVMGTAMPCAAISPAKGIGRGKANAATRRGKAIGPAKPNATS
jgi:hypothetical protein